MIGESIAFTIAYMLLRPYAGGFHAKTPIRCYIYSVIMVITVLLAIKLLPLASVVYVYFLVVGSLTIALFAPVEDKHKPLDETEQHVYRKRSLLLLLAEMLIFVICFIFQAKLLYSSIAMAILSIAILVMAGILKNTFCSKSA
jgi:accessory gene regulator B